MFDEGWIFFTSENNGCAISKNNIFVAFASIMNGLFVLNLDDSPICNINAKRHRLADLNPIYMLSSRSYKRETHEEAPFRWTSNFV